MKSKIVITLAVVAVLLVVVSNVRNWNWLRQPIAQVVNGQTGRVLRIGGDLDVDLGWSHFQVRAADITFSNPSWATQKNMIDAGHVALDIAIFPLFRGEIVLRDVQLDRALLVFEKSKDGRKNWLLNRDGRGEKSHIVVRHLAVRDGRIEYDDPTKKTRLSANIATLPEKSDGVSPLTFTVEGHYLGESIVAQGAGDPVLTLRDETRPYHLNVSGKIGQTRVSADGHITNLLKLSAVDLQITIAGSNVADLYPLIGVVFPDTSSYKTHGHLVRSPHLWRYEKFTGQMGKSDIAGTLSVDTANARPLLVANLDSARLDISDLGPIVGTGAAGDGKTTTKAASGTDRILPRKAFRTERWNHMDADVTINAKSIVGLDNFPLHKLSTRLQMRNARLTLDPLRFGVAGGTLAGSVILDGRASPIRATVALKGRKLQLAQLFPTYDPDMTSIGEFNGNIDLKGRGNSVAAMLGTSDGRLSLLIGSGEVSKLMMETVSLHLLEMLQLKIAGDEPVKIRCGIADFGVEKGVMQSDILVLDTDVSRIDGKGWIDLGKERIDLTLLPKTRKFSLIALTTPIHVQGSFAHPQTGLDKGQLALRALGAIALGAINPALALIPLIDAGGDTKSDCHRLIEEAKSTSHKPSPASDPKDAP